MSKQTLLFCLGAAKAGTGWLQEYLRGHNACYLRNLKELHYFDVLDGGGNAWHIKKLEERLTQSRKRLENHPDKENNTWLPVLIADLEAWLELFDGHTADDAGYLAYLGMGREDATLVGDFTPAYAMLSKEMLAHMHGMSENVKFIFLMREPVDRLWSNIRMVAGKNNGKIIDTRVEKYLSDADPSLAERCDYGSTLDKLLEVIPRDNLHLEYYERLFTQEALERVTAFLGIETKPARFERVVHKGRGRELEPLLRSVFQDKLKPQYNYIENLMGGLPPEWTDRMVNA